MEKSFRTNKSFKAVVKSIDEKNHIIDAIVSTESVDRDNEKILASAFDKNIAIYMKHPVLLSSHRYYELRSQIGEALSLKSSPEGLQAQFKYYVGVGNDEADWGFFLASKGMAAFSIGFIAQKWEDKTPDDKDPSRRVFTEVELVEISQVLVPSNREALTTIERDAEGIEKELAELVLKSADMNKDKKDNDSYIDAVLGDAGKPQSKPPIKEQAGIDAHLIVNFIKECFKEK